MKKHASVADATAHHARMKIDDTLWAAAEEVGIQDMDPDDPLVLELRNCFCGSTVARKIRRAK